MMRDRLVRISITKESFNFFFHFYYAHYVKYETAEFQKEIIKLLESSTTRSLSLVAFRGSGKSTLVTTAYPIWAILGTQQKKFCVIFCQNKAQAKQHMSNIRVELENNELLKKDLGPFQEVSDEWGSYSLVFKNHGARITVASSEQSIRGIRHGEHRPDLIICDDVEDIQSAKTKEGRLKTQTWLTGEVIPIGDKNTRIIIVGNLLHEDSLLMSIKKKIEKGEMVGDFREYPLVTKDGVINWIGKYKNMDEVQVERNKVGNEISWYREYLLQILSDDEQIIKKEWIRYYDYSLLPKDNYHSYYATGVDLAISQKDSADYTAMVTAKVIGRRDGLQVYILPNIVNKRMLTEEIVSSAKLIQSTTSYKLKVFVESNGMQSIYVDLFKRENINSEGIRSEADKAGRLSAVALLIQTGKVFFPDKGADHLVEQLLGFGKEKHDDMVDALSLLLRMVLEADTKGFVRARERVEEVDINTMNSRQRLIYEEKKAGRHKLLPEVIGFF